MTKLPTFATAIFYSMTIVIILSLAGCGGSGSSPVLPVLSVSSSSVAEGDTGTTNLVFTVTLATSSSKNVTVGYATSNNTASGGSDFTAISAATLTIPAGSTTGTVTVLITGDTLFETDENMTLTLTNPVNATIGTATATGTINNDDTVPSLSIANSSVTEGNTGTKNLVFTVTLNAVSSVSTTVDYATSNGTATAGSDYTAIAATTLTIPAGSTTGTINVVVTGDTLLEPDETMTLTLSNPANSTIGTATASGTITNDETAPGLSISDTSVTEGNSGTKNLAFTVSLSSASSISTTVSYATSNGTATAGSDYTAITATTLTIPAGSTTATINVVIAGDTILETDETMTVTLSNPGNAILATATATGTITNDEVVPVLSIASASIIEGDIGTKNLAFTVSLNITSSINTTVDYSTSDGTASAGTDYTAISSTTLTIPAGSKTAIVNVIITGDTVFEADENFTLTLSNPSIATLTTATATGTITNDDPTPVTMTISGKSLDFTWGSDSFTGIAIANIDHYRILVNPDGVSGFTVDPNASNISGTSHSIEVPVHKTNWLGAQYIVEACNLAETTCGTSSSKNLALVDSIAATIYVKSSNTETLDTFGYSAALSNDNNTLVVGAYGEDSAATGINGNQADNTAPSAGAVYVFVKTASGWTQEAYIKASNTEQSDEFGRSVALSGDGNTLAVGASSERSSATGVGGNQSNNASNFSGAVYVFTRSSTVWTQQAYVKASNTDKFDRFGLSIDISDNGNTLAIGAYNEASSATGIGGNQADNTGGSGAVYIFTRSGSTWTQQEYIKASNTDISDFFGWAISLSGDGNTLAVGAYLEDSSATGIGGNQSSFSGQNSGAVYVFTRSGITWSQQAYVKASSTGPGDSFGYAVALSNDGNTLAVGAFTEDSNATGIGGDQADNSLLTAGAVYLFRRTGTVWAQQAYIKASNTKVFDAFGRSVTLSSDGNTLAVGAANEDSNAKGIDGSQTDTSTSNSGAVYVFTYNGTVWAQKSYVKAPNTDTNDSFGRTISLSGDGDTLAVGADRESGNATGINGSQTSNSAVDSGAAYLF